MKASSHSLATPKGSVLIIVMVLLALFGLSGIALTSKSAIEAQIAGNHKTCIQSFYAAEAGFNSVMGAYYANPAYFTAKSSTGDMGLPSSEPDTPNLGDSLAYWISSMEYGSGTAEQTVDIVSCGTVSGTNSLARVKVRLERVIPVAEPFQIGILTNSDLSIGPANIVGSLHANGDVKQTGSGTIHGNITAHGSASVDASVKGKVESGAETIVAPMISSTYFEDLRAKADIVLGNTAAEPAAENNDASQEGTTISVGAGDDADMPASGPAVFAESGDQQGKIIFCEGDLVIDGSGITNATFAATGSITVSGSTRLDGSTVTVAIIAGGNIIMQGSTASQGVFWANGGFEQNGSGSLSGSIVCQGKIDDSGSFTFAYNGRIENENLPPGSPGFRVVSWKQEL